MPVLKAAATASCWPPDFALRNKVDLFLDPMLTATQGVFPTASAIQVILEADPELADDRHVLFQVRVLESDITDYVAAQHRWTDELFRVCPAPLTTHFRLAILPVTP